MAIDQKTRTIEAEPGAVGPAIENEIPTYRAISGRAIFSVACGVLSVCSFAHWVFYVFAILAIGLGIWAHRTIRQFPDMFTGQRLASAGIGLGLIFGLSAATITTVQSYVRARQATLFATKFAKILESGDKGQILWYSSHPELRKDKTGEDILKELESKPKDRQMMESAMGPMAKLNMLIDRIKSSEGPTSVRFVDIEASGDEAGAGRNATFRDGGFYEIVGPPSKKYPDEKQFALAVLKARSKGREYEWWSETMMFPYVPATYVPVVKPVGEGHGEGGHSH